MNPYKSNSEKENCSPISSNCVIWQGPNLPCINLCKGDTVSDVVYKLAEEVCDLKSSLDLSDLDITCLLTICSTTAQPALTLANILELLISKVCCISDILTDNNINRDSGSTSRTGDSYTEPILDLPVCLQYPNGTGGTVTQLVLSEYTLRIATVLCSINTTVINQGNQIIDLNSRVTILENTPVVVPQIYSCLLGTVADIDIVLQELETQFCAYKTVLGSTSDITAGVAAQCISGADNSLSTSGTMSSLPGWQTTVTNLGQSLQNLWITVCDMRQAVFALKNSFPVDCTQFILGFNIAQDSTRQLITLTFNALTTIPSGSWSNCPTLSTVTITDTNGHIYSDTLDLITESTNPSGITYDITSAGFNTSNVYTITVTGCIVKDGFTCSKVVSGTIAAPITTTTTTIAP